DETVRALGIVMEANLERDQAVVAEIDALRDLARLPVPEMQLLAVLARLDILDLEAAGHRLWSGPLAREHHVVPRLIPEVVVEIHALPARLPAADDIELVAQQQEAARRLAVLVTEHRQHDA